MAVTRYYSSTAVATELTAGVSDVVTTLAVAATTGFPASTPYTLIIDKGTADEEVVEVTGVAGLNLTVTRGVDSTTAVAHALGAAVEHGISARDFRESREHEDDTTAHGATGAVVGTTNSQTLTNKTMSGASNTFSAIPQSAVTSLTSDLAGKAATSHTHAQSDITSLTGDLSAITTDVAALQAPPRCKAFASSTTSVATSALLTSFTTVALDGESYDTDGMHDTVTNNSRVTIQTDGCYAIIGSVAVPNSGSAYQMRVQLHVDGAMVLDGTWDTNSIVNTPTIGQLVTDLELVAGNYVELKVTHNKGSSVNVETGVDATFLSVRRVSD